MLIERHHRPWHFSRPFRPSSCATRAQGITSRDLYFSCARNLARAQFQLADEELSRRLWEDVAERELDVDRILNLMYGCWFQADREAMQEADAAYSTERAGGMQPSQVGIFEHC